MSSFLVSFEDRKFRLDDLRLDEVADLEDKLGCSWTRFRPGGDAKHYAYIVATFLSRDHDDDTLEKLLEKVFTSIDLGTYSKAVEVVDDDRPHEYSDGVPSDPKEPGTGT